MIILTTMVCDQQINDDIRQKVINVISSDFDNLLKKKNNY